MGDLQRSPSPPRSISSLDLHSFPIDSELWLIAEQRTQEILYTIQPTLASEQKRKEVTDYMQRLIQDHLVTEVFPFGSVPFKTYLPDGDIDLTVLSHQSTEEDLAKNVSSILTREHQDPEFQVTDFQYVQAQVKVVKCSVKNLSFDISFNQTAGLYAVCFLEQVDQLIGKDHLFKRSIILIKAWCFYESRILGAHHGLISTYALEILILYIINLFHSSLPGPLAVLHRFLDYYSTFDWEKYCITINGPITISPQTEIVENNGNELLLGQEFLRNFREMFQVPSKMLNEGYEFRLKYLNIVDPLQPSNNLGRSVNKGNFYRIRCAISYGAKMLRGIILLPGEGMGARLEMFFTNTLERNGKGQRPDAQVPVPAFGTGRSEAPDLTGDYGCFDVLPHGQWYHKYTIPAPLLSPPSSPTQILQPSAWDALSRLLQMKKKFCSQRGTDVFLPRICHHCVSKPHSTSSDVDKLRKSRGTGTYIPDKTHHYYRDFSSWKRAKNPDSQTCSPSLKSSIKTNGAEVFSETKCGNGNRLDSWLDQFTQEESKGSSGFSPDFSLDEFPLLPCSNKSSKSSIHQSRQSTLKFPPANHCSFLPGSIQFGTFGLSPSSLGLPSSEERQVSTTLKTTCDVPKMGMQKQPIPCRSLPACIEF